MMDTLITTTATENANETGEDLEVTLSDIFATSGARYDLWRAAHR